ncbi:hypothetical protein [Demetria terragena]|uniref:hypothetical protein n=1 Tax=Demetria terragena TaxID=63959 RepID=UPI0003A6B53E|nr:hypothetical protein [Demetria terragena]
MIVSSVAKAAAASCPAVDSSFGTRPILRSDVNPGAIPWRPETNVAGPNSTAIFVDNRGLVSNNNVLQYSRSASLSLQAGCCYRFASSVYASAANPFSAASGGISGLIFFEGSTRASFSTRGATYPDWPGMVQFNVGTNPQQGVSQAFQFDYCATETREHIFFQFFRIRPTGVNPINNPGSDDMRFNALTVIPL